MKNLSLKSRFMYYSGILIASLGGEVTEDLKRISDLLDAEERKEADGCGGCAFEDVNSWEMPCDRCKRNSKDYWRAKEGGLNDNTGSNEILGSVFERD